MRNIMDNQCIFCKIVNGDIPARKVFENEHTLAFLDLSQVTPGHTLLIPKKHVKDIMGYNQELAMNVFKVLPEVSRAVRDHAPSIEGLNIVVNNGEVADQTVFHSHMHLIPRYTKEDDFGLKWKNNADQYSDEEMTQIQEAIQNKLEGSL